MDNTPEKKLFDLVNGIGEVLDGDLHIIDTTDEYPVEGEKSFRIYHKKGYCFDIKKEVAEEDIDEKLTYSYIFYAEWEGFKKLDAKAAKVLIKINTFNDVKH